MAREGYSEGRENIGQNSVFCPQSSQDLFHGHDFGDGAFSILSEFLAVFKL